MMPRVTIAEVAATLHAQSQQLDRIELQTTRTNGRVDMLETQMAVLKDRETRHPVAAILPAPERDWKVIGAGIGAIFFIIYGVVEVLRVMFDVVNKVGLAVTGKP
jgi:hypothetical protein